MLRREAGPVIPAKDDRALEGGKRATPPDSAQQGVPVRPAVVGAFLTSLEWGQHDVGRDQERLCSDHDFRCIGLMGVWGLYHDGGVVPAEVTGVMVWHPYYGEGASPHRHRGGHLGEKVGGGNSEVSL